jgi:hypothetical protein
MPDSDDFWDFYWEQRLEPMENLGKRAAILAGSRLIRELARKSGHLLRILELGCGEGPVIGTLLDAHGALCSGRDSVGVDYNARSVAYCREHYPGIRWIEEDFTNPSLLEGLGQFDLVLLVNAIHEVFSDCFSHELGEIDLNLGKQRAEQALAGAAGCLVPGDGGRLVLFDGLEAPGDPRELLRIRFKDEQVRQDFDRFVEQYRPLRITYHETRDPMSVEVSRRNFTRYITKSIFLGKPLWESERFESYQYFTEQEYRAVFNRLGLEICELLALTMNGDKWRRLVEIETPGIDFPDEHILITARLAQPPG